MYTTGHMAIAVAFRKNRGIWFLLFCMCLVMAPDIDFLIGIEHHTITHSISFCILLSMFLSILFKGQFFYFSFLILSHLVLDMLCLDINHNGIQLFWPFSTNFYQFPWHYFPSFPVFYAEWLELAFMVTLLLLREWANICDKLEKAVTTFMINLWRH